MRVKAILLIFFVCVIVYSNSLGGEFVLDDGYFVAKNINIKNLANLPTFFTNPQTVAFSELSQDVYRPITTLSYSVDYFFGKANAFGYHLVNVLFHSLNAILVFIFLYGLFGDYFMALSASLFFACHPINTEVVSWISGRSSVLFLFFYLLSLICYAAFKKEAKKRYYLFSLLAYAISLFSKEMAVTLPLMLISYDFHFFNKDALRKKIYRYIPYFALTLFFVLVRAVVLKRVSQCGWWGNSPYYTFLTMSWVILEYIKLLLLPMKLCAFYITNIITSIGETKVLAALAVLIGIFSSLPFIFKRSKEASFAITWFFITLLPVSNIVPLKALMAERFLYLPVIGFCIILAMSIGKVAAIKLKLFLKNGTAIAVAIAVAITVAYSARTMARNEDWRSAITISQKILELYPLNTWGMTVLGASYIGKHRYEEAIKVLRKAIALSPAYGSPKSALGICYVQTGRFQDAIPLLEEARRLDPEDLDTMNSLGVAYANVGRYEDAIAQFRSSIEIDPVFVNAYLNLGSAYEHMREYDKALGEYMKIGLKTKSEQDLVISYVRIADVYIKLGQAEEARDYYHKALGICERGFPDLKNVVLERIETKLTK